MTETRTTRPANTARPLTWLAWAITALTVVMAVLGILIATGQHSLRDAHGGLGYLNVVLGVIAAVLAFRHARATGRMGTFYHALALPILMVIQIVLAETDLQTVHMTVGIAMLVAAIGLATMIGRETKVTN